MTKETEFRKSFEADVPPHLQEDVLQRIVEAAWEGRDGEGMSLDVTRSNALNLTVRGTIEIEGREHEFHIRDGNNAGTEIISWNADVAPEREEAPREFVLAPSRSRAGSVRGGAEAAALLEEWSAVLKGEGEIGREIGDAARARAYDAYFAPGTGAARSHETRAARRGYEILERGEAVPIRRALLARVLVLDMLGSHAANDLSHHDQVLAWFATATEAHPAAILRRRILDDMAASFSDQGPEDLLAELRAEGWRLAPPVHAVRGLERRVTGCVTARPVPGFDPATLPADPVKEMFRALDPDLIRDVRVNAERAAVEILEGEVRRMTRERDLRISAPCRDRLAGIGYEAEISPVTEPEPDGTPEP